MNITMSPKQSQGGHQHHHDLNETSGHGSHGEEDEHDLDPVWKGLTALSGVYIMFLIEHFLTLGKMYKDRKKKVRDQHGVVLHPLLRVSIDYTGFICTRSSLVAGCRQ